MWTGACCKQAHVGGDVNMPLSACPSIGVSQLPCLTHICMQGCRECCFSTGGQYFAAVNGTTISIYNSYTCENVGNLRGHNGKVGSGREGP
jgi:hypothetical protein